MVGGGGVGRGEVGVLWGEGGVVEQGTLYWEEMIIKDE